MGVVEIGKFLRVVPCELHGASCKGRYPPTPVPQGPGARAIGEIEFVLGPLFQTGFPVRRGADYRVVYRADGAQVPDALEGVVRGGLPSATNLYLGFNRERVSSGWICLLWVLFEVARGAKGNFAGFWLASLLVFGAGNG